MGLLQAGIGALSGVLADQWREYFYCDSMPENVLMTKGVKRTGSRNANTKGEDNIISAGSVLEERREVRFCPFATRTLSASESQ